jgi:hypothetical protein
MASSSKKKTTMKKLNRENAVRERQFLKKAKKNARKLAAARGETAEPTDQFTGEAVTGDDAVTGDASNGEAVTLNGDAGSAAAHEEDVAPTAPPQGAR